MKKPKGKGPMFSEKYLAGYVRLPLVAVLEALGGAVAELQEKVARLEKKTPPHLARMEYRAK